MMVSVWLGLLQYFVWRLVSGQMNLQNAMVGYSIVLWILVLLIVWVPKINNNANSGIAKLQCMLAFRYFYFANTY